MSKMEKSAKYPYRTRDEDDAIHRLVNAAPEMLATLKDVRDFVQMARRKAYTPGGSTIAILTQIDNVIEKAEIK